MNPLSSFSRKSKFSPKLNHPNYNHWMTISNKIKKSS